MDLAHRRLAISLFSRMFVVEASIASAVIYACTTFALFVLFPGVFLSSRVTGAYPVTTDLIMRVNVRPTTYCFHSTPTKVGYCTGLREQLS